MKKYSKWGKNNPQKARWIIAFSHLGIWFSGLVLGILAYLFEWPLPLAMIVLLGHIYFAAHLFYPDKKQTQGFFKDSYGRRKSIEAILLVSYWLMLIMGTQAFLLLDDAPIVNQSSPSSNYHLTSGENPAYSKSTQKEKFSLRKSLKNFRKKTQANLKIIKAELKKKDRGGMIALKILLSILLVVLAIVMIYAITILGCALACEDAGGLAVAVVLLGWGATIWLGTVAIINIWKRIGRNRPTNIPE
ncbi:MAG: hypothetical protein AAFY71_26125 [Bacteroidota bacterium]